MSSLFAFLLYLGILLLIAIFSYSKGQTSDDFNIGSRKMNFYLTAFAAHASDMSAWIFLAYPAAIFMYGISAASIGIGLSFFMFLNWQFIAPKLRVETEKFGSLTLSSYFESRYSDTSGALRIFSSSALFLFFTVYISAGLVSLGILLNSIFAIPYAFGVILGMFVIIPYLFIGGYVTLAWTDCFQGIFLLFAILIVPSVAFSFFNISTSSFFELISKGALGSQGSGVNPLIEILAWGLPYFGLPHVLTKFMGISDVKDMYKAKWVGISWQLIALIAATLIGLTGRFIYQDININPEFIFIEMTTSMFPLFFSTFILCAILGATISCMGSQILVVATSITEDIYKKVIHKSATSKRLVLVTRLSIFFIAFLSCIIALNSTSSIMSLVSYAWFGLGASFGPLVLFSLYSKSVSRLGAAAGLITGALSAAIWPFIPFPIPLPSMIPAFILSSIAIKLLSIKKTI
jgi:sodium/proline symporter